MQNMVKERQVALSWREHDSCGVTEEEVDHMQRNCPAEVLPLIDKQNKVKKAICGLFGKV